MSYRRATVLGRDFDERMRGAGALAGQKWLASFQGRWQGWRSWRQWVSQAQRSDRHLDKVSI